MTKLRADALDPQIGVARILDGRAVLPAQFEILRACSPSSPVTTLGIFGGWGGGKTTGQQLALLSLAVQNPWTEAYGMNRPATLVLTETIGVMRDSLYASMMNTLPDGLVAREARSPAWDIELTNGHVFMLRTDLGANEGATVCTTVIDEVHKLKSKLNYLNYVGRARDSRAAKNMTIVSGLPIDNGWLREEFDRRDSPPDRLTIYMRTGENPYLPPVYVERLRGSCSPRQARTQLDAEWSVFEGAIYEDFDATRHFVPTPAAPRAVVHLGIDAGHQAAFIVAREVLRPEIGEKVRGLHVVDEIYPDSVSVEAGMRAFFARGHRLTPGKSYVCVDPKMDADQLQSITRVLLEYGLGAVAVIQKIRGDPAEAVGYGIRCVQAAIMDANRRVRLTFAKELPEHERGLRRGMVRYRWNPRTRQPVKDDRIDHGLDGLRYIVAHVLPSEDAGRMMSMDDFTLPAR